MYLYATLKRARISVNIRENRSQRREYVKRVRVAYTLTLQFPPPSNRHVGNWTRRCVRQLAKIALTAKAYWSKEKGTRAHEQVFAVNKITVIITHARTSLNAEHFIHSHARIHEHVAWTYIYEHVQSTVWITRGKIITPSNVCVCVCVNMLVTFNNLTTLCITELSVILYTKKLFVHSQQLQTRLLTKIQLFQHISSF